MIGDAYKPSLELTPKWTYEFFFEIQGYS